MLCPECGEVMAPGPLDLRRTGLREDDAGLTCLGRAGPLAPKAEASDPRERPWNMAKP